MRCLKILVLVGLLYSIAISVVAQESTQLKPGYYVVVGAYARSKETIASDFVNKLKAQGLSAQYGVDPSSKLLFTYIRYDDNLKASLVQMSAVRNDNSFPAAWVRVVPGDISGNAQISSGDDNNVVTSPNKVESQTEKAPASATSPVRIADNSNERNQGAVPTQPVDSLVATDSAMAITENPDIVQYKVMTLGNTDVFLSLFNARNNRIVDGEVQVIDTDRARLIKRVKGNEYLGLPDPKSNTGQLTLICESFGYRKIQQEINYPLPLADTVKPFIDLMGTTLVINFDLIRYHKGDIATLYNVYFFNDASLMRPESKYELNSLLELMNENKNYKIRLHGHTNGRYFGKIFGLGDNKNFFSLDGSKESKGSAKDLSKSRADIIREFLIASNVESSRIEIKAWGGRRPLFDRNSDNAKRNVRVEVEILSE